MQPAVQAPNVMQSIRSYALVSLPFLLIILALALGHNFLPVSYPARSEAELVQMLEEAPGDAPGLHTAEIEQFLRQDDAAILYGRALYPIHFKADMGALNYSWLSFAPKPYPRLSLYVIGPSPAGVIFATESRSAALPDGADVIVLGCRTESGDIDALSIAVTTGHSPVLYQREPLPPLTCPLAAPPE